MKINRKGEAGHVPHPENNSGKLSKKEINNTAKVGTLALNQPTQHALAVAKDQRGKPFRMRGKATKTPPEGDPSLHFHPLSTKHKATSHNPKKHSS